MAATSSTSKLAQALATMQDPSSPATILQGVVTAWNSTGTPPTVTCTLSGDTTPIPNLQYLSSYLPNVGDVVQIIKAQGSYLVIGTIETNAYVAPAPTVQGPGTSGQCVSSGGVNRTTQPMFWYVDSAVITVSGASGWDYASSGPTINGCGMVHATPGDSASGLVFLSVIQSHVYISGGQLNIGGAAYMNSGGAITGIGGGNNIRVNISALCW